MFCTCQPKIYRIWSLDTHEEHGYLACLENGKLGTLSVDQPTYQDRVFMHFCLTQTTIFLWGYILACFTLWIWLTGHNASCDSCSEEIAIVVFAVCSLCRICFSVPSHQPQMGFRKNANRDEIYLPWKKPFVSRCCNLDWFTEDCFCSACVPIFRIIQILIEWVLYSLLISYKT